VTDALKRHWPEYLIEGSCLGLFMVSAFAFGTLLEHPASPVHRAIADPLLRRLLMGLAMGATAIGIIYSPWGKQSGAHINPSTTLTFFRLGKVPTWDAVFYIIFQFIGGAAGALVAVAALSTWVSHPAVNYVVTRPGSAGARRCVFRRNRNRLHFDVRDSRSVQPSAHAQANWPMRGLAGRRLHNS
jgi:aquaporin Z